MNIEDIAQYAKQIFNLSFLDLFGVFTRPRQGCVSNTTQQYLRVSAVNLQATRLPSRHDGRRLGRTFLSSTQRFHRTRSSVDWEEDGEDGALGGFSADKG